MSTINTITDAAENTKAMKAMEEVENSPKEGLIKYLGDFHVSEENIFYDSDNFALFALMVYYGSCEFRSVLVLRYSKEENAFTNLNVFRTKKRADILEFCEKCVDTNAVHKSCKTTSIEEFITNVRGQRCDYNYIHGKLSNNHTGEEINIWSKLGGENKMELINEDIKREGYEPLVLKKKELPDNYMLEYSKEVIKEYFLDPEKYGLEVRTIQKLKSYKCIVKESIDKVLGKEKDRCYKLLASNKIMYHKPNSQNRYGYRCRENDDDIWYIAITEKFLEGGE